MSDVYFFTDHNKTIGPFGSCSASEWHEGHGWAKSYQGPSEKISLVKGSLASQAVMIRIRSGPYANEYVAGIAGNFTEKSGFLEVWSGAVLGGFGINGELVGTHWGPSQIIELYTGECVTHVQYGVGHHLKYKFFQNYS